MKTVDDLYVIYDTDEHKPVVLRSGEAAWVTVRDAKLAFKYETGTDIQFQSRYYILGINEGSFV